MESHIDSRKRVWETSSSATTAEVRASVNIPPVPACRVNVQTNTECVDVEVSGAWEQSSVGKRGKGAVFGVDFGSRHAHASIHRTREWST